jgi:sigma-54 dependent transcriptional regulator, acetoin dehydrogenase operon transcriptional activator AcoR
VSDATVTDDAATRAAAAVARRDLLYRVIDSARPLDPPSRHALDGVDRVTIGRGERGEARAGRELRLSEPDNRVSGEHARLERRDDGWTLIDLESKNGTLLNGAPVHEALLVDGDLVEVARACFLFRTEAGGDADARDLPLGLATLSPALGAEMRELAAVARSAVAVVLQGETGTGKEVAARAVHALSGRSGPFVAVNCGGIPPALVASELFGVTRGAFSDAREDRPGLVRAAHTGTLFLDEIGDLPLEVQVAFLRVLQEREVLPIGQVRPVPVDVRVISATHRPLPELVAAGKFREDLWARLNGYAAQLPPLRERRQDLGLIVAALLRRLARAPERVTFQPDAMRALLLSAWPRNVRELEKRLEAALVLACDKPIERRHLGDLAAAPARAPASAAEEARRRELERLLEEHAGNLSAVARALGRDRAQVRRWLARYGLDAGSFKR